MKIKKLSPKTRIGDCAKDLWKWLGMSKEDVNKENNRWHRYPMISDLGHHVWLLEYRGNRIFGKSKICVIIKLLKILNY